MSGGMVCGRDRSEDSVAGVGSKRVGGGEGQVRKSHVGKTGTPGRAVSREGQNPTRR